jgi:hypothetical protein
MATSYQIELVLVRQFLILKLAMNHAKLVRVLNKTSALHAVMGDNWQGQLASVLQDSIRATLIVKIIHAWVVDYCYVHNVENLA